MRWVWKIIFVLVMCLASAIAGAQQGDVVRAKAHLENLVVGGYTRELSTRVADGEFQISARIELSKVEAKSDKDKKPELPLTELDLTYIDPVTLYKNYTGQAEPELAPFANFMIKKIELTLGLKDTLSEEVKKEAQDWLEKRVKDEFGKIGSTVVTKIRTPSQTTEPVAKSTWDQIRDFQHLVGQGLLALALILGVLLYAVLGARKGAGGETQVKINSKLEAGGAAEPQAQQVDNSDIGKKDESDLEVYQRLSRKIGEMIPQLGDELPNMIKEWCQSGERGILQVATLADAAGAIVGRLPIPSEFRTLVADVFKEMQKKEITERVTVLQTVYWDVLAALNLGSQTLHVPFSFMSKASIGAVSDVLMQNNARMRTIVTLFMDDKRRGEYVKGLTAADKEELLNSAAELSEISEKELLKLENQMAPHFTSASDERSLSLGMSLAKVVEALSIREACELLPKARGWSLVEYKKTVPSLAFLPEWTDAALTQLFKIVTNEEMVTYLKFKPDMQERALRLVPPMMKAIMVDDLKKPGNVGEQEQEQLLLALNDKMRRLVESGEVDLASMFSSGVQQGDGGHGSQAA